MHWCKTTIQSLGMASLLLLASCAGARHESESHQEVELRKVEKLDSTYIRLMQFARESAPPDTLLPMLTDDSRNWLDTMEQAALQAPREDVEKRPFHEIMTIVTYRLLLRENQFAGITEHRMLRLSTGKDGILQKVSSLSLGPFEVRNDRGFRGLSISPKVPVLVFTWDDRHWKLDLIETLPLVTRGFESIGVKKDWTPARTVLFLLDKHYHNMCRNLDESLLDPVPSI